MSADAIRGNLLSLRVDDLGFGLLPSLALVPILRVLSTGLLVGGKPLVNDVRRLIEERTFTKNRVVA